jgi:spermidine synthase
MTRNQWKVAGLLFFSGFCALVYQTVWLRQFRLIFGASTFATGAVLAIFMAGLGAGSVLLGKRADEKLRPLAWYARLELLIAASAALSPLLLILVAKIYFASGGSPALGIGGATVLRLVLSVLVLGPATVLMGGTLPAAARAVETNDFGGRRGVALLYGLNTLGAVAGALLSTFVLLEHLGNTKTLLVAVIINATVALVAGRMSVTMEHETVARETSDVEPGTKPGAIYAASAIAGFAFLLMELVWYRMLSPILGGTAYMFGLVLAIALLGIGIGGTAYAIFRRGVATTGGFAVTCSFEALAIAAPFALGDRLAIFTANLQTFGQQTGFAGHVLGWTIVTFVVVFPSAFIAGVQFPLLIGLLGRGRESVGRHIGAAYAWNTAGAIAGAIAGGFGLLPILSAPTIWRLVAFMLALLATAALFFAIRDGHAGLATATVICALFAVGCAMTTGPTAAWRHSGIGVGRMPQFTGPNELKRWMLDNRRMVLWQRDGRESSVALTDLNEYAFIVNGKSDGGARGDAATQVMAGLIGAILHPNPKSAFVVGLGTGSTSGWLAKVPSIESVRTVELEPVVLDVARACSPVNAGVMTNPKVDITIADAREVLLTSSAKYDVVASEPSNPYRAGVASLFTSEFYEAVADHLNPGGVFAQWVQAYGIGHETMRTIYATLTDVFPYVQTWATQSGDLVLVASKVPIVVDTSLLRGRIATQPYSAALFNVWRVSTVEGFLGRMVANETFARGAAKAAASRNTDDRTVVEFSFARSLGVREGLSERIPIDAAAMNANRPTTVRGAVNWEYVKVQSFSSPTQPAKIPMILLGKAQNGDVSVEPMLHQVAQRQPIEAAVILAALRVKQGELDLAASLLHSAFIAYRKDPWPDPKVMAESIELAMTVAATDPRRALMLREGLSQPFTVGLQDASRRFALMLISDALDKCGSKTVELIRHNEPFPYWTHDMLRLRTRCYVAAGLDLAPAALRDLQEFDDATLAPIVPETH